MEAAILSKSTREIVAGIEHEKNKIAERIKKLIIADTMDLLDFSKKDKLGFVEYTRGVFIRDITSEQQKQLNLTILEVYAKDDIEIEAHEHILQSQSIAVKQGKIYDLLAKEFHLEGEQFIVQKKTIHHLKYFAGSRYFITFIPQLTEA